MTIYDKDLVLFSYKLKRLNNIFRHVKNIFNICYLLEVQYTNSTVIFLRKVNDVYRIHVITVGISL